MSGHPTSEGDPATYRVPDDDICVARDHEQVRCTEPRIDGSLYCARHMPKEAPPGGHVRAASSRPVDEGLAVVVETGQLGNTVRLMACTECGVLLWDVEAHWLDAHARRLFALRARAK